MSTTHLSNLLGQLYQRLEDRSEAGKEKVFQDILAEVIKLDEAREFSKKDTLHGKGENGKKWKSQVPHLTAASWIVQAYLPFEDEKWLKKYRGVCEWANQLEDPFFDDTKKREKLWKKIRAAA